MDKLKLDMYIKDIELLAVIKLTQLLDKLAVESGCEGLDFKIINATIEITPKS